MTDPADPFSLASEEPVAPVNDDLPSEEELLKAELKKELDKTEEEINTLRQVLTAKEQHAAELRKSLGMTTLGQMKAEIARIQSSQAYQKTQETLKTSGQATASFFSSIGSSVTSRFSEMNMTRGNWNSPTFKSLNEKIEGAGTTIMAKVSGNTGPATTPTDNNGGTVNNSSDPVTEQPNNIGTVEQQQQQDLPL